MARKTTTLKSKAKRNLLFKEKFDPALISALYQNFNDPIQAILELVDNAVDDIVEGRKMYVTVDSGKDSLCIVNKGGLGMGAGELASFFVWGRSDKRGKLGRYGQGGKAAMGYLGKTWKISSTRAKENQRYIVEEPDWDDRTGGLKKYKPKVQESPFAGEGVVQIDISRLKRKINKNELRRFLAKVYRPLIKLDKIEIHSNGQVMVPEFPLSIPEEYFGVNLSSGKRFGGWLSFLEPGSQIRGGVRCYVFGRLIVDKEYFGQKDPTFKETLDKLIGEVYLDLDDLPLLINKSDFDRGSSLWKEIKQIMYEKLDPYIKRLLEEKEKDLPTEGEKKAVEQAGKIWLEFMKSLYEEGMGGQQPGLPIAQGQKSPELQGLKEPAQVSEIVSEEHHEPATPPPPISIGKRKRTGGFPKPVLKPLHESVRYESGEDDGVKVIVINNRFPLYKLRKSTPHLYIWETLALDYARDEGSGNQTAENFAQEVNYLLYKLGKYLELTKWLKK